LAQAKQSGRVCVCCFPYCIYLLLDFHSFLQVGSLAVAYYLATTAIAVVTGIILVLALHPGNPQNHNREIGMDTEMKRVNTIDAFMDLIR
jgi:Na+/H+-dicarboxylate symporter